MVRNKMNFVFKILTFIYIVMSLYIISKIHSEDLKSTVVEKMETSKTRVPMNSVYSASKNNSTTTKPPDKVQTITMTKSVLKPEISLLHEQRTYKNNRYVGLGENGSEIIIPKSVNTTKLNGFMSKKHGFNLYLSDLLGVHRSFGDCRPQKCRDKKYPSNLPPASVVIIFRDEYASIVLRTAYSVLDTTPPHLLKDIVLVDDGSVDHELKMAVDIHVANVEKFHLVRNTEPLGLMMSRQRGIEASQADYFIVMDSHMEVCEGWMEPIINRLVQEPKTLLSPQVGGINKNTLKMEINEMFDRSFMYLTQISMAQAWVSFDQRYIRMRNGSVEPLKFPVMQGMILAMKREFFFQLGGFDPGMRIWGTEQMELSVKVWLCGGQVEILPCSRVGHLFRVTPWGRTFNNTNHVASNRARFAAVWLEGEHRDFVLDLQSKKGAIPSDGIEARKAIKQMNNCKPYKYFLDQVKELANIYVPNNTLAVGRIYNNITHKCFDNIIEKKDDAGQIGTYSCHEADNQYFVWTENLQIRFDHHIIYVKPNSTELYAKKTVLEWNDPSSRFYYRHDNTIVHEVSRKCVTVGSKFVHLQPCMGSADQLWEWKRLRQPKDKQIMD